MQLKIALLPQVQCPSPLSFLQHHDLLGRPALPIITAVVEPGMPTAEIANLLHRRGASPALVSAQQIPQRGIQALVAAGMKQVPPAVFAHAAAGGTVTARTSTSIRNWCRNWITSCRSCWTTWSNADCYRTRWSSPSRRWAARRRSTICAGATTSRA